jgi:transposase-like protein
LADGQKELAEPGKKLRDTGMERDILKKATAIFP